MDLNLHLATVGTHLPLWFLLLALILPRLSVFLMWLGDGLIRFHLGALLPPLAWLLLPRALVLYLIYLDQGVTLWFVIHLVVALMVWGGSGRYHTRRRSRRDFD